VVLPGASLRTYESPQFVFRYAPVSLADRHGRQSLLSQGSPNCLTAQASFAGGLSDSIQAKRRALGLSLPSKGGVHGGQLLGRCVK